MDIGIIGGGSIGLLFAAYLIEKGNVVTLYTRSENQASILNQHGITKEFNANHTYSNVSAACYLKGIRTHELIIIAVKQYHLSNLLETLHAIPRTIPLLFLQNGMSHIKLLAGLDHEQILVGVVEHGALKKNETMIFHSGVGTTKIGIYKGNKALINSFIEAGSSTNFPIQEEEDWYDMLLSKLVVNAMINPLTALLRVENGQLIQNPHFFGLFTRLYEEIVTVLKPEDPNVWWEAVKMVCENTAKNRSSMLRDVEQSKPTEIDGILGFLRDLHHEQKCEIPFIHFLYQGIKGLEN
jgi:2-dehydropantoate 2-reductase